MFSILSKFATPIMGGLALVIVAGGLAFYFYFQYSQNTISSLTTDLATSQSNVSTLKGEVKGQNDSIRLLEQTRQRDQERMLALVGKSREYQREVNDLKKKFRKHDLNNLSLKKPGLIEKIINRGTAKVFRELENLTKEPTKNEKPK